MSEDLFINITPAEIRSALLVDDVLVDLIVDQNERTSVVGNVYLGRVERVMNGMQAAFIGIGLSRSGFLGLDNGARRNGEPDIPVHEGEQVIVQVTKDALEGKGVQLSRRIALPGRYLVYAPRQGRVMVSRQIDDEAERDRLTEIMTNLSLREEGFIVRTAAVGVSREELESDCKELRQMWHAVEASLSSSKVPSCLHEDLDPMLRVLRDHALDNINSVHVDDAKGATKARDFCERVMPGMADRVRFHTGPEEMFEQYGIEEEVSRAGDQRVELISGGSLVIETLEALTAIDVNSGRFDNASDHEQIAFLTNCEAAQEAARQIRLRNISGLIVVDFIHMEETKHWNEVIETFEKVCTRDRNPTRVLGRTNAGLVEVTRRRRREPLLNTMTQICGTCGGVGRVRSMETISAEILRSLRREARVAGPGELVVYASEGVVDLLENTFGIEVDGIEDEWGRTIVLRVDKDYVRDSFDIVAERANG